MRTGHLPGVSRLLATRRVLALAAMFGVVTAVAVVPAGVASAASAPHRLVRYGARALPGSGMTLAQAPAGLRAAVRRTLGRPAVSVGSYFQKAELTPFDGVARDTFGFSVAISGSTAVVGALSHGPYGTAYIFARSGSAWSEQAELTPPDGTSGDLFAVSVAISGSTVVVGAPGRGGGTAYIFEGSGTSWSEQVELTNGGQFGWSVAISGSTVVVGAISGNSEDGAAYVFTGSGSTWTQQAELTAAGGANSDSFGFSVAISGSTVVVGAFAKVLYTGWAYVFTDNGGTWSEAAVLTHSDGGSGDFFGISVAVSGSTIVVGADGRNSVTGAVYVFTGSGSTWTQRAELSAPDGALNDAFGRSVAVSGSTIVVGAPGKNTQAGAAYMFTGSGSTWSLQTELTASDAAAKDGFGYSLALAGSTLLAGAPVSTSTPGAAYVFGLPSQQAKLTASTGAAASYFGGSVAISGSTAVVGAPGAASNPGAAYVFTRSGSRWSRTAGLGPPGSTATDLFGNSVAISGSTVVVGEPGTNSNTGAVWVFTGSGSTWSRTAELTAGDGAASNFFGYSVALDGSTLVVGAANKNSSTGAVYVFTGSGSTWSQRAELTAAGGAPRQEFGDSLALDGSTLVVGAPGTNTGTGAAYVFTGSGRAWSQRAELTAADAAAGDAFGWSVALSKSTVVVGAPGNNSRTGAAYVFTGSGSAWSEQAELTASNPATDDEFGWSVALFESTALVGARGKHAGAGGAYLFDNV